MWKRKATRLAMIKKTYKVYDCSVVETMEYAFAWMLKNRHKCAWRGYRLGTSIVARLSMENSIFSRSSTKKNHVRCCVIQ